VAKYTGREKGPTRSWNDAGKGRFNDLMVEVYSTDGNAVAFQLTWSTTGVKSTIPVNACFQKADLCESEEKPV